MRRLRRTIRFIRRREDRHSQHVLSHVRSKSGAGQIHFYGAGAASNKLLTAKPGKNSRRSPMAAALLESGNTIGAGLGGFLCRGSACRYRQSCWDCLRSAEFEFPCWDPGSVPCPEVREQGLGWRTASSPFLQERIGLGIDLPRPSKSSPGAGAIGWCSLEERVRWR